MLQSTAAVAAEALTFKNSVILPKSVYEYMCFLQLLK